MLEEAGEVLENMLKASCLPLGFIVFLPAVLLLVAPPLPAADAAHEFTVYRMQQYDLQGQPYGTRNAVLNTEARTMAAEVLSRRCVLMRLLDFSYEQYQKALRQSAGAVVIILPRAMAAVPQDVVRQFMEIEPEMLAMETIVPVYFAVEDEALLSIYEQTQAASASQGSASAAEVLLRTATANGFQMVTSGVQSKAVSDWLIASVEGRLTGLGGEDLPTIVIVAHYDAFGVAPWLSLGADSNGSGVSVLLELARLFSRLYTYKRTHAAYNLLFFASGGGKFNYQGTKRWLEDNLDHTDSSLLQDNVAFVLCLDTVGRGSSLHLHVSKPPREGTLQHAFLRELETVAAHQFPEVRFSMVHKRINLAEDVLAWEHERFAIRRLPAFTLSHLESHRDGQRSSIMDVRSRVDSKTLTRNTRIIAEALTRVIYNLTEKGTPPDMPVFTEQMVKGAGLASGRTGGRGRAVTTVAVPTADPAGAAGLGDGLAHQPAPRRAVGGQGQHLPQHAGASPEPLPEGRQAAPRQGRQAVRLELRTGPVQPGAQGDLPVLHLPPSHPWEMPGGANTKRMGRGPGAVATPAIPVLWEAEAGGSLEVRSLRPA
uniref:BOS complex subunit NCLN n=1 Tax=Piliocolobus tephrosceles TaxID=591936 RepID=A0A8C9HDB3_9PRIM